MRALLIIFLAISHLCIYSQIDPQIIGFVPTLIDEASGLECPTEISCWTFNDSGDNSRLFKVAPNGTFISQTILENANHQDYEDITRSEDGRYFIGDFGNNQNDRQNLRIYIIEDLEMAGSSVATEVIEFQYSDQTDFPPSNSEMNFDVEAMIHFQDSLFLFTRNRTNPYNGLTKFYSLSDESGTQTATLRGALFGNLSETYNSVTGADISPDGNRIALLSEGSITILTGIQSGISNAVPHYNYFSFTNDLEGISFIDDCRVRIIEEGVNASLYELNTCNIITGIDDLSTVTPTIMVKGNEIVTSGFKDIQKVQLLDGLGSLIHSSKTTHNLDLSAVPVGLYLIIIQDSGRSYSQAFIR